MRPDRRRKARRSVDPGQFDPLWLVVQDGQVGTQAELRDVSATGLGIVVNRSRARRVIAALEEARATEAAIEVTHIPRGGNRRAHVVWALVGDSRHPHFGPSLAEPLDAGAPKPGARRQPQDPLTAPSQFLPALARTRTRRSPS